MLSTPGPDKGLLVDRVLLVKIGGSLMEDLAALRALASALAELQQAGTPLVLVHGGGKDINKNLAWLGEAPRFVNGLRVTSPEAMKVVEMTLSGSVNKHLVSLLLSGGARAVGVSGVDGGLLRCRLLSEELGQVGAVEAVEPGLLFHLLQGGFLPVVSPVSLDEKGQACNVNADDAASGIAMAMQVDRLLFLSDVEGVLDADKRLLPRIAAGSIEDLIAASVVTGGMIPKLRSCEKALSAGIREVHICGFKGRETLLRHLSGEAPSGTVVESGKAG